MLESDLTANAKAPKYKKSNTPFIDLFGSSVFNLIQKSDADIVNLHWINAETLSIKQISKLNKPIIMTLHDMWAFCGCEHYSADTENSRFRLGYSQKTKDTDYISGIDLNKFTWNRKHKYWRHPFTIVTPSKWLSRCARESALFSNWDVYTIPNALDTELFKPIDQITARQILNLPRHKNIIGFGAIGGGGDPRKGFDLLKEALVKLSSKEEDYCCVVFGQSIPESLPELGLPIQFLGHLHDDVTLALFYSAIDVMVVPSRQEAFGQTASEAHSCGTPVVAFNTTSLADIVEHKVTGYLAEAFNTDDLAKGVEWCLDNDERNRTLSENARNKAVTLWSEDIVATQYIQLYEKILASI